MTRAALAACGVALAAVLPGPRAAAAPPPAPPPSLRAPAAILIQPDTGDVVVRRNASARRPIASTTKLMTALLTLESGKLDRVFAAVAYSPAPAESVIGLRAGERLTVRDLLRGLLLASANDAAVTLAARIAGSRQKFVARMNARARRLGLRDTHYTNPVGLDAPGNRSSAEDLVKLSLVLLRDPFFAETVNRPSATLRSGSRVRRIVNRNSLVVNVPFVDGVKTGHTSQAGYVLVGAARRDGVRLVSAVLGDPSEAARNADSLALLRYGLSRYRRTRVVMRGRSLASVALDFRDARVRAGGAKDLRVVTRRGERAQVRVTGVPSELSGDVPRGRRVGTVEVRRRGRVVARTALVTLAAVPAASLSQRLGSYFGSPLVLVILAIAIVCSLQLALLRRRAQRRRRERERARAQRQRRSA